MKRAIIDLNIEPRVYTVDNFLTNDECLDLIAIGQQKNMSRALVSGEKEGVPSEGRTNENCWINHNFSPLTKKICARVAGLIGLPLSHAESLQLIYYGVGAEYRAHFDAFKAGTVAGDRNMENGGQRVITALCYLNNVTKGGGTKFTKLNISIPAERGKLVVFHNCIGGTHDRHPLSLHAGMPVLEGQKWAFNLWFRAHERI